MRDRVETGIGMLFVFGLAAAVSWWWHGHTSAPSLWWAISLVSTLACVVGIGRAAQLILSGFSGFGRNYFEERELPEEPQGDGLDGQTVALNSETSGVIALPLVLLISGAIVTLLRVFPAMNFIPEFEGDHWVSPRFLVPWMFFAGIAVVGWSILLRIMMKTGPDRWTYVPGTRAEIRKLSRIFVLTGIILIAMATAYTV